MAVQGRGVVARVRVVDLQPLLGPAPHPRTLADPAGDALLFRRTCRRASRGAGAPETAPEKRGEHVLGMTPATDPGGAGPVGRSMRATLPVMPHRGERTRRGSRPRRG